MKLELNILQHVINGVQIEILNYKSDYVGIRFAKANGYYFLNNKLHITYEGGSTGKSLEDCRLILKPLSDLTREDLIEDLGTETSCLDWTTSEREHWIKFYSREHWINNLPYLIYSHLLKNHFDVFGLVEAGLAIDINTLKN
jgi:hypothetical protein